MQEARGGGGRLILANIGWNWLACADGLFASKGGGAFGGPRPPDPDVG